MSQGVDILIVEDSLTQAVQLQDVLERHGHRVTVARDGFDALERLREHRPALVISDVIMPEMDGCGLCRRIREQKGFKDIPVILLTSLSDPDAVIKALESGADNFVTKPYDESFLMARVKTVLHHQELRKRGTPELGIEVVVAGNKYTITSDRMQIIDFLFSTYENALQKNQELERANSKLIMMQQELEKRNIDLEELNEQKNRFLSMAAHDLRNPLAVISGYSEILLYDASEDAARDEIEMISVMRSSSEFMLQIVNEFLDIAKIEAGKLELDLKITDVMALMKECISLNRVFAVRKQMKLLFRHDNEVPAMMMDSCKIEQVMNNLISNAIKYSYPQSSVEIRIERSGHRLVISVRDEGQGIPEKELDKLFRPFEKTSVRTTAGETSTGLGLAIAKKIVESHEGYIWVESEVGRGSIFFFDLPIPESPS